MTVYHSPAQVTQAHLINLGVGVWPTSIANSTWPIFVARLPDKIDNAVRIMDSVGGQEGILMSNGEVISKPGVQVVVRTNDYPVGYQLARVIANILDQSNNVEVLMKDVTTEIVTKWVRTSDVIPLGDQTTTSGGSRIDPVPPEDLQRGRTLFVINYRVSFGVKGLPPMELPSSPTPADHETYGAQNKSGTHVKMGTLVAIDTADTPSSFVLADATAFELRAIGFLRESDLTGIPPDQFGAIQVDGILMLHDWTSALTAQSALTTGTVYYLDPDHPGRMTHIEPVAIENQTRFKQIVGRAVATDTLKIDIRDSEELVFEH